MMADPDLAVRVSVYKVTHIETGRSYIGITRQQPAKRWRQHGWDANNPDRCKAPLHRAILKYGQDAFAFEVIFVAFGEDAGRLLERDFIASHNTMRPHGFNLTSGGEMLSGTKRSEEANANNRAARLGKVMPSEVRAKISAALKGRPKTPEHAAAAGRAQIGRRQSDETRRKVSIAMKALWMDPAEKAGLLERARLAGPNISAGKKRAWADPEFRERMKTCVKPPRVSEESRRKAAAALKIRWAEPGYREMMAAARDNSPKVKAFRSRSRNEKVSGEGDS
jgi:hypothetical protein